MKLKIIGRATWGSRIDPGDLLATSIDAESILYIHHSATKAPSRFASKETEMAVMRSLERGHLDRGFVGIGYSYVVFPSGRVYRGRGFGKLPAATLNHNSHSGAICFVGNFDVDKTTWPARRSAIKLARMFKGQRLLGHRDAVSTDCPGRNLYAQLPRIRQLAKKRA